MNTRGKSWWPALMTLALIGIVSSMLFSRIVREPIWEWEKLGIASITIKRSSGVTSFLHNYQLRIIAEKASLDYERREIKIESPKNIIDWHGGVIVKKIDFNQNQLVVHIPYDVEYRIDINGQKHILTKAVKKEIGK